MREFLAHCLRGTNFATGQRGTPLDFIAFHAKGTPTFVDGHVRMGIASHLRALDQGFALVSEFPELKDKPIIIGESDPDGCAACQGPQLGYRNTTMYSSYTAAVFARHLDLAERHRVNLEGAVTWAFEFENQPWFAGFRVLASNGISLPVFNVFRMFSQMGGQRLPVASTGAVALDTLIKEGVRGAPDVSALASLEGNKLCVMVWPYHDDDVAGPDADVRLNLTGLPAAATLVHLRHYRIDRDHSNAFTAWQRLGSPAAPTPDQYVVLERSAQLAEYESRQEIAVTDARLPLTFALPRQAVSLLILEWE
jgi:xylan 1,4-beta-xylosidase